MSKPISEENKAVEGGQSSAAPFVHCIRVRWGDCDPAAIAYTPNIPAWALEAIEAWWEHVAGIDWYHINIDRNIGTPFVHMSLDFKAPVTPRHILECEVTLANSGRSSVKHWVRGYQNGALCFEGHFVSVFINAKEMKPRRPPADILSALEKAGAKSEGSGAGERTTLSNQD
jgi:acyl-CoA thioesterase FadM